jgi:hypothetical protein
MKDQVSQCICRGESKARDSLVTSGQILSDNTAFRIRSEDHNSTSDFRRFEQLLRLDLKAWVSPVCPFKKLKTHGLGYINDVSPKHDNAVKCAFSIRTT